MEQFIDQHVFELPPLEMINVWHGKAIVSSLFLAAWLIFFLAF